MSCGNPVVPPTSHHFCVFKMMNFSICDRKYCDDKSESLSGVSEAEKEILTEEIKLVSCFHVRNNFSKSARK